MKKEEFYRGVNSQSSNLDRFTWRETPTRGAGTMGMDVSHPLTQQKGSIMTWSLPIVSTTVLNRSTPAHPAQLWSPG